MIVANHDNSNDVKFLILHFTANSNIDLVSKRENEQAVFEIIFFLFADIQKIKT